MRKSYFILMPLTLALLVWAYYEFSGVEMIYFLDLPSLLIIPILPLLMTFCTFRPLEIRDYFAMALNNNESDSVKLEGAIHFFHTLQTYAYLAAGISFVMAVIYILSVEKDISRIGPMLAVALICILYSLGLAFFITLPLKAGLRKLLHELPD